MINCSIVMRPNPLKEEEAPKAYACAQSTKNMDINQFAEHISTHGCVYGRADIAAILTMAVDCIRENLLNGTRIKLGDLGDFSVSLKSIGAETAADFNIVPSRKAANKILKAIKAGETTVNLDDKKA